MFKFKRRSKLMALSVIISTYSLGYSDYLGASTNEPLTVEPSIPSAQQLDTEIDPVRDRTQPSSQMLLHPQPNELTSTRDYAPEAASRWTDKPGWVYPAEAVAAANPLAAQAGLQILKKGGNAVDAAIAVQMVLSLVEPQSSGIGGGGFMVLSQRGHVVVFDGREVAPQSATENLFLKSEGKPFEFKRVQLSSRSIGVPGIVAMLWQAHRLYGKLSWKDLIQPAIELCDKGFMVSPRLFQLLLQDKDLLGNPYARDYFYQADLTPWPVGYKLKNPELGHILRDIAIHGSKAFYTGTWARAIVDTVNLEPKNQFETPIDIDQRMTLGDLKNYKALIREPLCFDMNTQLTRGSGVRPVRVCGAPPPASGTLAMAQILGMLSYTPAKDLPFGPQWLHYYAEASRLALADRAKYVSDPSLYAPYTFEQFLPGRLASSSPSEFKTWQALIGKDYLQERAKLIGELRMDSPEAGIPDELRQSDSVIKVGSMPDQPEHGTSHISVIDRFGGAVSFTTSIESAFGVHRMVNSGRGSKGGFLLNSELTDFSFLPFDESGKPIANRPGPGKRPRSSMTPTVVLTGGQPAQVYASLGSPGGSAIIHFTAQTLWAMLEWRMSPQEAINLAHFTMVHPKGELILEKNKFNEVWLNELGARQQLSIQAPLTSGVQAIERVPGGLSGGADPRREGIVLGR